MMQNTSRCGVSGDPVEREGPAIVLWLGLVLIVVGLADAFLVVPLTDGVATGVSGYLIFIALGWVFFALCMLALAWHLVSGTSLLNRPKARGACGFGRYLAKVGITLLLCSWISLTYVLPGTLAREDLRDQATNSQVASLPLDLGGTLVQLGLPELLIGVLALLGATVCSLVARLQQ